MHYADVPEPPEILELDCGQANRPMGAGRQQALIVWRRPEEHGSPVTHFTVEQITGFHSEQWAQVLERRNDGQELYKVCSGLDLSFLLLAGSHPSVSLGELHLPHNRPQCPRL